MPSPPAAALLAGQRFRLQGDGARTWRLDAGAALPVTRLQMHIGLDNAVLPLVVSHRLSPKASAGRRSGGSDKWSLPFSCTAYRLRRDGVVVVSPPVDIDARPAREWRYVLDERVSAPDTDLEFTLWRPGPQVVALMSSTTNTTRMVGTG